MRVLNDFSLEISPTEITQNVSGEKRIILMLVNYRVKLRVPLAHAYPALHKGQYFVIIIILFYCYLPSL